EREDELDPQRIALRVVAGADLQLPLHGGEPALAAVVLQHRADRERAALAAGQRHAGLLVGAELAPDVAACANGPIVAEAPAERVVEVELVARAVVGVLVAQVEDE